MMGGSWKRVGDLIETILFRRARRQNKRSGNRDALLRCESLEPRQLLSANQITYDPTTQAIVIEGTASGDVAQVWLDASNMVQVKLDNLAGGAAVAFARSSVTQIKFFGGDGDDRFANETNIVSYAWGEGGDDSLFGGVGSSFFVGGNGNDHLYGNISADSLDGGDGNDQLFGRAGDDYLVGGAGDDGLYGDDGNDQMLGDDGADYFEAGAGADRMWGGAGKDYMLAGAGDDGVYGQGDDDELFGEDGADYLDGGQGVDSLSGAAGDDYLVGGLGNDGLYGHDGNDQLFGDDGADYLDGGAGNDKLFGRADNDYIIGGLGDDGLYGDDGDDQLFGQDGTDYIEGGNGNDKIWGATGNDYLLGGAGDDGMYGQDGDDRMFGEDGTDYLDGGVGNDGLFGGAGDDYIVGGVGDDGLYGDDGFDRLVGQDGADYFQGGADNDTIWGGLGADYALGGVGDDTLYGEEGDDQLFGGDGADYVSGAAGFDLLLGGLGDDYLLGGDGGDRLSGEGGSDRLYGEVGTDFLDGGDGNDYLWGAVGRDFLYGGAGDDTLYGNEGWDYLEGQNGADYLSGGDGIDSMLGGAGDDFFVGGNGDDLIRGEDGNDQLYGESGADSLDGGAGNDTLGGGAGNDGLLGGAGVDSIFGDEGNDYLVGGDSGDMLSGGTGNDILIGGAGVDQFNGDADDDILIGGTTSYDADVFKLRLLAGAWSTADPYLTRVQTIENELFAAHLESNETVFDDRVVDSLFGAGGQDWFFMTGYSGTYIPPDVAQEYDDGDSAGHHKQVIVHEIPELEGFEFIDTLDKLVDKQSNESAHSLVPHADSASLQREHLSLYQLVRYDEITNYAVRSGAWSDPGTWKDGAVPTTWARVLIPMGVTVQVDGMIQARISTIRVDGKLSFMTSQNSELRADTVIVTNSGSFEMGTEQAPIANGVTARLLIIDNGAINRAWDPFGISRGLISHGSVSIYGAAVSSYMALSGPVSAGTKTITLRGTPLNWKVNDVIVVAATTEGAAQNETRRIVAINGNTITLDTPLTYSHSSPAANLDVHVANISRNAVIESESTVIDRRGHVMFMHNRDVHIAYGGFYRLGRTNKLVPVNDSVVGSDWKLQAGTGTNPRGRYSVHFHRNGLIDDGNPATIYGSAVYDSPGWGFVNHTSYVTMSNNVAFDVRGAAFATEVGNEIGTFSGNLAIGATGSSEEINKREPLQDFGFQGDGFWFQGAGVRVIGNIAAGNQADAFVYYNRGLYENGTLQTFLSQNLVDPSIAQGATTISIGLVPIAEFSNNIGYASARGILIRYHLQEATHGGRSIVSDSQFWNNLVGVDLHYAESVTLRRLSVIHDPGNRPLFGILTDVIEGFIDYENLTVGGYINGMMLPRWGTNTVTGGTFFNNNVDILIPTAVNKDRIVNLTGQLQSAKIAAWQSLLSYPGSSVYYYFVNDRIILNFGLYQNQRLYGLVQKADAVPFPSPRPDAPSYYIGLTTQQLWDQYHVAIGNAVAPSNAITVPLITGLLAPNL